MPEDKKDDTFKLEFVYKWETDTVDIEADGDLLAAIPFKQFREWTNHMHARRAYHYKKGRVE